MTHVRVDIPMHKNTHTYKKNHKEKKVENIKACIVSFLGYLLCS